MTLKVMFVETGVFIKYNINTIRLKVCRCVDDIKTNEKKKSRHVANLVCFKTKQQRFKYFKTIFKTF
jgi:hypothetical protein